MLQYDGDRLTQQDVIEGHNGEHGPCRICGVEPEHIDGTPHDMPSEDELEESLLRAARGEFDPPHNDGMEGSKNMNTDAEILEDAICTTFDGLHICNRNKGHDGACLCACGVKLKGIEEP